VAESESIVAGLPVGRYEILSLIGAGGMGELYRARDPELGRELVVKLLPRRTAFHPEALERFVREARAASALNHPNIITVYEVGESPKGHFIAMELIEGRNLRDLKLDIPTIAGVAKIGAQAARALAVAHAAGIIHRDIKPDNLMLRDDGYLKVLDFGIAQLGERGDGKPEDTRLTQPGMVVGTMRYMSPEQATGAQVTSASDIFSLGIVLYELAAGRHPFDSSSDMGTLSSIILRDPLPPSRVNSRVPESFDELIMRMLAKDPAGRPTATEVHETLESIVALQASNRFAPEIVQPQAGVIGRENELSALNEAFANALGNKSSLVCVSGEPGIGKTTVVEAFLRHLAGTATHSVALGRCSERLAGAEAYLPLLDAIDDLMHGDGSMKSARLLEKLAPTWWQMLSGSNSDSNDSGSPAQSQERLKRELASFLEKVCELRPLVLLIEDIHWADSSTVDVLSYVLTRLQSSRLVTIATYRPTELQMSAHPFLALKLDLQTRGFAREIPLAFLSEENVGRFIDDRFPGNQFPPEFKQLIHSRTEGSPLFVEDLLRYLRDRCAVCEKHGKWEMSGSVNDVANEIPESMRSMVERKIGQLEVADRNLLAAASVQGHSFDSAIVAEALNQDAADVEDRLDALDRIHGFVRRAGEREFPGGHVSGRYRFVHVLYQNSLFNSLPVSRRVQLSRAVGEALLRLTGSHARLVAAELGFLFETARDLDRAATYFAMATDASLAIFAYEEASNLARRAIALIGRLDATPERKGLELGLQLMLGSAAAVTGGYAASEAAGAMERARTLAEEMGNSPQLSPALWGLHAFYLVSGKVRKSLEIAQQALAIAESHSGEMALLTAHADMAISLRFTGRTAESIEHFEKAAALYDPAKQREYFAIYHMDPGLFSLAEMTRALWTVGDVKRALETKDRILDIGRKSPDPRTNAFALLMASVLYQLIGDPKDGLAAADEGIAICDEHSILQERAWITTSRGWALTASGRMEEGLGEISTSIAMRRRMNADLDLPYAFAQLAGAHIKRGEIGRARTVLADALEISRNDDDLWYVSELYRLLGEAAMSPDTSADPLDVSLKSRVAPDDSEAREGMAESYFRRAVEVSKEHGAKSFELRATRSLCGLLMIQGRRDEALALLEEIRHEFDGQIVTPDIAAADKLLASLRSSSQG
jgi:serine/threonine protein kinase/tetratricopeptide (TPR) repeat protein